MYAVIKTGGKQYKVANDDVVRVERLGGEAGDTVVFDTVLMADVDGALKVGAPTLDGFVVTGEIVEQTRGPKVISCKKRRRKSNSRSIRGHRQHYSDVKIVAIGGDAPKNKAAAKTAESAKVAAPKAAKAEIKDDLSLISGVGPVLVKKLNDAGITSLKQVAELDAAGIEALDEKLSFKGRIEREEWVDQAKELLAGKAPRAKVDQKVADTK